MNGIYKIIGEFGLIVKGGQCHAERGQNSTLFDNSEIRKMTNNNFNTSLFYDWQFNPSGFFILGIFCNLGKCKKVLIVIRKTAKI